jgi:glyoxylase-like metal-dependent hydrolase (beta-lactamase superfamily II)
MLHIKKVVVGAFEVNCWIIWGDTKQAIVIDPGADADSIRKTLKDNNLTVTAYMLTHGHADHISALADIQNTNPAEIGIHQDDAAWAFTPQNNIPPFYSQPTTPKNIERNLIDNQNWQDTDLNYTVIATPGHTPGGVCFYFPEEKLLFCGDTLFAGSAGRTDLPGGNSRTLAASLKKLAQLPGETKVHPGHGPTSTIEHENKTNFFMKKT